MGFTVGALKKHLGDGDARATICNGQFTIVQARYAAEHRSTLEVDLGDGNHLRLAGLALCEGDGQVRLFAFADEDGVRHVFSLTLTYHTALGVPLAVAGHLSNTGRIRYETSINPATESFTPEQVVR